MEESPKIKILHLLHENSRLSHDDIATMLGMDTEEVSQLISELEQDKIILQYSAIINWEKVESQQVTAVIDVKVTPQREVGFDVIAERIYRFPEVKSVSLMSGAYDLQVVLKEKHLKDVALFVSQKLSALEHVNSTTTHFLLKTYKSDGVIFEDREDDQRLVIHP